MLSWKIIDTYTTILTDELRSAMGCTEPIAIAYAASIVTDALGGAPGVYSARYAGEPCDDEKNNQKLLAELDEKKNALEERLLEIYEEI